MTYSGSRQCMDIAGDIRVFLSYGDGAETEGSKEVARAVQHSSQQVGGSSEENHADARFDSAKFKDKLSKLLSGAVQIATAVYEDMDDLDIDPRWGVFSDFLEYLETSFPGIYSSPSVTVERINKFGLLYTVQGSDESLAPMLLMAHQDVVPVSKSTVGQWTHEPWSGHIDDRFVWGRGSADDKGSLISMLVVLEDLLESGYKPARTIIYALGFDEEGGASTSYGAGGLAKHLLERYGENGIEIIIDEGSTIDYRWGSEFAFVAMAEKGYCDITITISTPGGHSSQPPDHTAIGYLASAIQMIEANPFPSVLTTENPTWQTLQIAAEHSKEMPNDMRKAIRSEDLSKVVRFLESDQETRPLVRTTTAVDVIRGGDKANALPEQAFAKINHRIAVDDSVQTVKDKYITQMLPLAEQWNFRLNAFGVELRESSKKTVGTMTITSAYDLEPSPLTDTGGAHFSTLKDVCRSVFGEDIIVAPCLMEGNTDTSHYWDLSPQIYRMDPYRASWDPKGSNIHTINERMPIQGLVEMVRFYRKFILEMDELRA